MLATSCPYQILTQIFFNLDRPGTGKLCSLENLGRGFDLLMILGAVDKLSKFDEEYNTKVSMLRFVLPHIILNCV